MDTLKKIENQLEKELDKIAMKSELTANDLEALHYATKVMKCLKELEEMDWDDEGYSNRSPMTVRYKMPMNRNYTDYGYSRHSVNDRVIDRLEKMMDEASSEYERDEISKMIRMIRASQ